MALLGLNILVFPSVMPESINFAQEELKRGNFIIGASSVPFNKPDLFSVNETLPFVTEPDFDTLLVELISKYAIDAIYSPHPVTWQKISESLNSGLISIVLLNEHPAEMALESYRKASAMAAVGVWSIDGLSVDWVAPTQYFRVGLLHALRAIPGQSSYEKLSFLSALVMNLPRGDIVEIGSLWGRSAYALSQAAHQTLAGPVLCIDPWSDDAYAQPDSSPLLERALSSFVAQNAFNCFLSNLVPFAGTVCNYLRMTSTSAVEVYRSESKIKSEAYGITQIHGFISLLHIDGNHDLEAVEQDLAMWTPHLCKGGWLVLDDYCWAFGNGPRTAGDNWFKRNRLDYDIAFVAFDSLFLRKKVES